MIRKCSLPPCDNIVPTVGKVSRLGQRSQRVSEGQRSPWASGGQRSCLTSSRAGHVQKIDNSPRIEKKDVIEIKI